MRSSIANALALWGVLTGLWFAMAGVSALPGLTRWEVVVLAPAAVTASCWALGLLAGPAWAERGAELGQFWRQSLLLAFEGGVATVRAILGLRQALRPALVQHPTAPAAQGRGLFALGASMAPGIVAVSLDDKGVLIHSIHDDEADDEDLRALQAAARRASSP